MKFADRLKFTAVTGTSAATITFSAAIGKFRTPAQAIADGALKVGDTDVPFTTEDTAGNTETSLFTVESATVFKRTSVLSSSAGGTTPATFTGALTVFSAIPAKFASSLATATTDAGGVIELLGGDGLPIMVTSPNAPVNADNRRNGVVWTQSALVGGAVRQWVKVGGVYQSISNPSVAIANPIVAPTAFRSVYTQELSPDVAWAGRIVMRDPKRTSLIIRNPNAHAIQYARSTDTNDKRNNPGSGNFIVLAPGQELYITDDIHQYWAQPKILTTTAMTSSGTTATATIAGHGLRSGDSVEVANAVPSGYRATVATVTVVDANTITYTTATADLGAATGQGIVLVRGLYVEIEILGAI